MAAVRPSDLLRRLIAIPSPQTDLFEAEPQVLAFIDEVATIARELGLTTSRDRMGNLATRVGSGQRAGRLLLMGYAMTHPAGRMIDPFLPRDVIDENGAPMVRGRGTSEQKGALASALAAMAALVARPVDGEVVLMVSTAGETGRHDAARAFMDAFGEPPFVAGVVLVGTNREVCVANKGRLDVEITIRGRSGHSSTPWTSINAIDGAVEALRLIGAMKLEGSHPGLGEATVAATHLRSWPEATHTIQDEVRVTLDRRLLPGQDPEAVLREVREAIGDLGPYKVQVDAGAFMYPSEVPIGSEVLAAFKGAYADAGLVFPEVRFSHGALDAGFLNHLGIPAVMFGPGDQGRWHTDDEAVAIDDLDACQRILESFALRITSGKSE